VNNEPTQSQTATVYTLQEAAAALLLPGTLGRAREALSQSEALQRGLFLADPDAPLVFGALQAAVSELIRTIDVEAAA
jgi:hypothetical protein